MDGMTKTYMEDIKMKKTIFCLVAAMAVLACSKKEENEVVVEPQKPVYTLYGTIAQETGTKVEISPKEGGGFSHHWQADDAISVFNTSSEDNITYTVTDGDNITYTVTDESVGYSTGTFKGDEEVSLVFYAIYPYNDGKDQEDYSGNAVEILKEGPAFTVKYPASQVLTADSYDPDANVYVATGSGDNLTFYNTTAYLRLALYSSNSATVSKIELTALSNTDDAVAIAGTGTVKLTGETPTVGVSVGGNINTITLNGSVSLAETTSAKPKYFYVAVPAIDYVNDATNFAGYQVKIYSGTGAAETYQFRNFSTALTANKVRLLPALEYNPVSSGTATLVTGQNLNMAIKTLAKGSPVTSATELDSKIKHIIIETNKNMTGYTGEGVNQVVVNQDGEGVVPIIASWNSETGTIRIQTAASKILTQSCAYMFYSMRSLIDITGFDGVKIGAGVTMAYMFMNSNKLKKVDLSNLSFENNTTKANSCLQMFAGCSALQTVSLPDTEFLSNHLLGFFQNCSNLSSIDNLDKIKSSTNLTNVSKMFYGCSKLTSISFRSTFTCSYVTNMSEMFSGCSALTNINLSNFNTAKVTNASKMFYNCSELTGITFGDNCTFTICENCSEMFRECSKLSSLDVGYFQISETAPKDRRNVQDLSGMFRGCTNLTELIVPEGRWARYVMNTSEMFKDCSSLTELDIHGILKPQYAGDINKATSMFEGCSELTYITMCHSNFNYTNDFSSMFCGCTKLYTINFKTSTGGNPSSPSISTASATSLSKMFSGCKTIQYALLGKFTFSTDNVTNMSEMFNGCEALTNLNLTGFSNDIFNAEKVTDMSKMFYGCSNLATLTLGGKFIGADGVDLTDFVPSGFTNIICSDDFRAKLVTYGILSDSN